MRTKLFSVGIADCRVDTFTVGGHGGSGKDTSNTGVRITHEPSGAVGESREERSQLQNKRAAFRRMAESKAFKLWVDRKASEILHGSTIEQRVEESMTPDTLKVEYRNAGGWYEV